MWRFCFIVRYCLLFSFFALVTGFISAGFYRDFGTQTAGAYRFFLLGKRIGAYDFLQTFFPPMRFVGQNILNLSPNGFWQKNG